MRSTLSQFWETLQGSLFPLIEEALPPLLKKQQQFIATLEMIQLEQLIPVRFTGSFRGRPEKTRLYIARAFIAKAIYNIPTTRILIDRLHCDNVLRRLCGWEQRKQIPSESVFSRAFAEFAESGVLNKIHASLIKEVYDGEIVGHVSTDASAIEAREKPIKKEKTKEEKEKNKIPVEKNKGGRPKKGMEPPPKELTRIQKQVGGGMSLEEMIEELPKLCDKGGKTNAKGNITFWVGYKLHLTVDDNCVPLASLITSASMHDSQAAVPMAKLTEKLVENFYDLMDAGYAVDEIREHSKALGHVPIIDQHAPRGGKEEKASERLAWGVINWKPPEMKRYEIRTTVERTYSRLKDEFGARFVRVRGAVKVHAHLMFGILALAADQLLKIVSS